jgi:hypothetical protein
MQRDGSAPGNRVAEPKFCNLSDKRSALVQEICIFFETAKSDIRIQAINPIATNFIVQERSACTSGFSRPGCIRIHARAYALVSVFCKINPSPF